MEGRQEGLDRAVAEHRARIRAVEDRVAGWSWEDVAADAEFQALPEVQDSPDVAVEIFARYLSDGRWHWRHPLRFAVLSWRFVRTRG